MFLIIAAGLVAIYNKFFFSSALEDFVMMWENVFFACVIFAVFMYVSCNNHFALDLWVWIRGITDLLIKKIHLLLLNVSLFKFSFSFSIVVR